MAHRVVSANQQLSRLIRVLAPHTLLLARASAQHDRPALVVGGVTSVGYLGFMFGPTIMGLLAQNLGLRAGLASLALAASLVAVGA